MTPHFAQISKAVPLQNLIGAIKATGYQLENWLRKPDY